MRYADLEPYRQSAFGRYIARSMSHAMEGVRMAGMIVAVLGAWRHSFRIVLSGAAIILFGWLLGKSQLGRFMDRSYKEDIPKTKKALEELKKEFSGVASTTDWTKLRIEPLLDHVKSLERLLRSPKFARETARLRRGVVMFHSDLVYLRENVKALKEILDVERRSDR